MCVFSHMCVCVCVCVGEKTKIVLFSVQLFLYCFISDFFLSDFFFLRGHQPPVRETCSHQRKTTQL